MHKFALLLISLSFLIACNKVEGPGGTSTITGTVTSQNHQNGVNEVTEIIFVPGLTIDHGDYWILNNPVGQAQFYIYYDNPDWVSEADPGLEGRTGIPVSYNYSDSNVEIAVNTMTELLANLDEQFRIARNVDVLTIEHLIPGEIADADKITTPFEFNISKQGKNPNLQSVYPAIDEKVYLIYGDQSTYGELTRTGGDGEYQFQNLTNGNYTVYAISKDTLTDGLLKITQEIEITEKKSVVSASEIKLLN